MTTAEVKDMRCKCGRWPEEHNPEGGYDSEMHPDEKGQYREHVYTPDSEGEPDYSKAQA